MGFAAAISFLHVPLIEYWLSTAWFVATLCLILIPASTYSIALAGIGLVVLLVLVPTNPEVFGIAEYTLLVDDVVASHFDPLVQGLLVAADSSTHHRRHEQPGRRSDRRTVCVPFHSHSSAALCRWQNLRYSR